MGYKPDNRHAHHRHVAPRTRHVVLLPDRSPGLDDQGAVLSETRYLPFGAVRDDVGTLSQTDFGYTFQRSLPDTDLMDYKARFYDPSLNRFLQPDTLIPNPANPQSWNRYAYTYNNPINYTDPSGHDAWWWDGNASEQEKYYDSMPILRKNRNRRRDRNPDTTTVTPTLCPKAVIECLPTPTSMPSPTATPTPYTGPSYRAGEPYVVTKYGIDRDRIDIFEAGLDIAGIVGDAALIAFPEGPGEVVEGIVTAVEVVSIGKAVYDAVGGDLRNLSTEALVYGFEHNPTLIARSGRWIPIVGSIGSGYSLYNNVKPAITVTKITKYR